MNVVRKNPPSASTLGATAPGLLLAVMLFSVPAHSQSLQAVNLRSTAGFAVLAGSLISNVPTSAITGHIGLSPASGGNITGFGATEVTGTVYAVDASGPAGSVPAALLLTTAKGDLTLAYDDAAGRVPVPSGTFLNPGSGSGNIGGLTLAPGLYKFTSTVAITGSDLTLAGTATDVWIFQIASSLTLGNGIKVVLSGGARAANVFWQVGTSAMLGTTSVMKGSILADQSISLNTGANLEGRALARIAAVTLASGTITQPGEATSVLSGASASKLAVSHNTSGRGIAFTVPGNGRATLILFQASGQKIAVLFDGHAAAGARNESRFDTGALPRGLYFTKLEFNGETRLDRILLGE